MSVEQIREEIAQVETKLVYGRPATQEELETAAKGKGKSQQLEELEPSEYVKLVMVRLAKRLEREGGKDEDEDWAFQGEKLAAWIHQYKEL